MDVDCKNNEYCNFEFGPYGNCTVNPSDKTKIDNILLTKVELNYVKTDNNYLDKSCTTEKECNMPNSYCALFRQKCACKESFIYDKNTKQCVKG